MRYGIKKIYDLTEPTPEDMPVYTEAQALELARRIASAVLDNVLMHAHDEKITRLRNLKAEIRQAQMMMGANYVTRH